MIEDVATFAVTSDQADRADDGELLLSLIASEIFATASSTQAENFFTAVGRRLARLVAMEDVHELGALAERINALWQALGWGGVRMELRDDGILLTHQGLPRGLQTDVGGHWPVLLRALLRGAYDSWFRALGSGDGLRTTILRASDEELELHHGL